MFCCGTERVPTTNYEDLDQRQFKLLIKEVIKYVSCEIGERIELTFVYS